MDEMLRLSEGDEKMTDLSVETMTEAQLKELLRRIEARKQYFRENKQQADIDRRKNVEAEERSNRDREIWTKAHTNPLTGGLDLRRPSAIPLGIEPDEDRLKDQLRKLEEKERTE